MNQHSGAMTSSAKAFLNKTVPENSHAAPAKRPAPASAAFSQTNRRTFVCRVLRRLFPLPPPRLDGAADRFAAFLAGLRLFFLAGIGGFKTAIH
ncbi:MAG: hypothetical protein R3F11_20405 [Verrucomicrobiales bacterium]